MDRLPQDPPESPPLAKRKRGRTTRAAVPSAPRRPDTADMAIGDLAEAILSRSFRPRVGEIRRLADYVQRKEARRLDKLARKEAEKTARKLSKIPKREKKR